MYHGRTYVLVDASYPFAIAAHLLLPYTYFKQNRPSHLNYH